MISPTVMATPAVSVTTQCAAAALPADRFCRLTESHGHCNVNTISAGERQPDAWPTGGAAASHRNSEKEPRDPKVSESASGNGRWQFWIDRGGTFTDIVACRPDGALVTHK